MLKIINSSHVDMTKPFLKWVGGKTQIIDHVLETFPPVIINYHEPFLGGGSVLIEFLTRVQSGLIQLKGKVYASDLNSNLIGLYKHIQSEPEVLVKEVQILAKEFSMCTGSEVNRGANSIEEALTSQESYYFWIRSRFNSMGEGVQKAAMFLFLNKTCFRGLYREGPKGFNVPFGNYKNPSIIDKDNILKVSKLIQDVVFTESHFKDSLKKVYQGDFVYLDPPYAPKDVKSFVSYTSSGFGPDDHKLLFTMCKGLTVVMSNADVPLVRDVFKEPHYKTKVLSCRRAINSKEPDSKTNEVLIQSTK
jgi:DNA adenine methylase